MKQLLLFVSALCSFYCLCLSKEIPQYDEESARSIILSVDDYYHGSSLEIEGRSLSLNLNDEIYEFGSDFDPEDVATKCPPIVSIKFFKMSSTNGTLKDDTKFYEKFIKLINSLKNNNVNLIRLSFPTNSGNISLRGEPFLPVLLVSVLNSTSTKDTVNLSKTYAYAEELTSEYFYKNLSYVLAENMIEFGIGSQWGEEGIFVSSKIIKDLELSHTYTLKALKFNTLISRKTLCIRFSGQDNSKAMLREIPLSLEKIPLFIEKEILRKESPSEKEESISLEDLLSFVKKKAGENQYNIIITVSGNGKDADPNKETIDKLKVLATQKKTLFLNIPNTAK